MANEKIIDQAVTHKVMNCEVQDATGLNDFQKIPDRHGIAIPRVGINRFRVPLTFKHRDGSVMNHDARVRGPRAGR